MKRLMFVLGAAILAGCASVTVEGPKCSGTTFAKDALAPYVENGQLPGAISVFYKDGVQETCCIGYADVAAKRPITLDDVYMQCSQTKGFCGQARRGGQAQSGRSGVEVPAGVRDAVGEGLREGRRADAPQGEERADRSDGAQPHGRLPV